MSTTTTTDLESAEKAQKRAQWEQFSFDVDAPGMVDVTNESYENPDEHQYTVTLDDVTGDAMACTCPHHVHRHAHCKHMADQTVVELVIPSSSRLVGETLASSTFRQRYDANVLAFRSRGEVIRTRLDELTIHAGDTLLIQADTNSLDRLARNNDFILAQEVDEPEYRTEKIPHAIAIMVGVVGLVAVPWTVLGNSLVSLTGIEAFTMLAAFQQDILVTALAGVVAMVVAGVLNPNELYDSVDWNVIFLLAEVIPLGTALERTGAAQFLGNLVAASADFLPVILVLWLFYIATGLITEVISNNASVVLMIPVAAAAAEAIGANPFAFVLAVTFAASTAFLGPVGYQTNLFVYGPGGYKFSDYFRIGAPLQIILSTVTVLGIAVFWGL